MSIREPKIGGLVKLKSGGPVMTIKHIGLVSGGHQAFKCIWFTKDEQLNEGEFRNELLEGVKIDG
ncbi:DUF2158 domain-containing protein [Serratia fonticola]|uniref:DUF2158 domain-containing protein n=1 Tax=Serratia fonticola TaxID=47917 RepID=UPI00093E32E1|nr:DUF2158 domain-containing protein [Serratia fonticola]OKP29773.1 hypothetical protein BSQ40_08050 [Serratia fonticola]